MAKGVRGQCALCGYESSKAGITRHLKTCPGTHDSKGVGYSIFHLRVDGDSPLFFLDLEIKASASLADIDLFLRNIWLECCGHLSMFTIGTTDYQVDFDDEEAESEEIDESLRDFFRQRGIPEAHWPVPRQQRSMNVKLTDILSPGLKFDHEYDFGTSTNLKLKVVSVREGRLPKGKLRLLARNTAPEWTCNTCDATAELVHTEEIWESSNPFYCKKHAQDDDYLYLPVVNSPRMGMCGYSGDH